MKLSPPKMVGLVSIWFDGKKSSTDNSWIDQSELQKIDPDILEQYESSSSSNSTESSSFQTWGEWCGHHKAVKATVKTHSKNLKSIPKETQENYVYLVLEKNFIHEEVL